MHDSCQADTYNAQRYSVGFEDVGRKVKDEVVGTHWDGMGFDSRVWLLVKLDRNC